MGGALILLSGGGDHPPVADLSNRFVWVVLLITLGLGAVGWVDDYRKVVYRDPKGLPGRWKYFWQSVIGLVAAFVLAFAVSGNSNEQAWQLFLTWLNNGLELTLPSQADLIVPFFQERGLSLGRLGLRGAVLLRDRGQQQCGQPDRWPRWPGRLAADRLAA